LLGDIIAKVRGTISSRQREGREYLHVDTLNLDLDIKTVRMLVKKVFNNNRILGEYVAKTTKSTGVSSAKCYPLTCPLPETAKCAFSFHVLAHFQFCAL
jgi:pantoate kinase